MRLTRKRLRAIEADARARNDAGTTDILLLLMDDFRLRKGYNQLLAMISKLRKQLSDTPNQDKLSEPDRDIAKCPICGNDSTWVEDLVGSRSYPCHNCSAARQRHATEFALLARDMSLARQDANQAYGGKTFEDWKKWLIGWVGCGAIASSVDTKVPLRDRAINWIETERRMLSGSL